MTHGTQTSAQSSGKTHALRPKLTQYLIDKAYVTEEQCSEALQRQVIFGGRVGTNLLELFYITEDQLLDALSHTLHVPVADKEKLKAITPAVLQLIPEDLARKYQIIPFEASKSRIHLAMIDPTNMEAMDEISFITGRVIKPFVEAEAAMTFLLEKYYGIRREMRFVSIPEEEKRRRQEWEERKKKKAEQKAAEEQPARQKKETPRSSEAEPAAATFVAEASLIDLTSFEGASRSLSQAGNRDEIAKTLLTFANFRLERAVLFIVKGDQVQAWKAGGIWKTPEGAEKIHFPLKEPTLIHDVAESNTPFKGPLSKIEIHKKIIGTLGAPYPKEIVAFPLAIRKRVFSILYGDNGFSNEPFREIQEVQKIALKAALAFEVLILKAKILFQG